MINECPRNLPNGYPSLFDSCFFIVDYRVRPRTTTSLVARHTTRERRENRQEKKRMNEAITKKRRRLSRCHRYLTVLYPIMFIDCSNFRKLYQISTMSNDEYTDDDDPSSVDITEDNPNTAKKEKCNCKEGCSTRSCSCFKFGSGCNSSCECSLSCENMFNHLEYFFGENNKYSAHPCFTKWLVKKAKNTDGLKTINRRALCQLILGCDK
jgi:hypothetical protein